MGWIAVATAAGIILYSSDKLEATKQLAIGMATDFGVGLIFLRITGSAAAASGLTALVFLEGDSTPSASEKARLARVEKDRMIDNIIKEHFPQYYNRRKIDWTVCVDDVIVRSDYHRVYSEIEFLIDNPYILEKE